MCVLHIYFIERADMKNGADNLTAEKIAELRENINLSEIPEIKDFSKGYLRELKKKVVSKTETTTAAPAWCADETK